MNIAEYLDGITIQKPMGYGNLAVYPLTALGATPLNLKPFSVAMEGGSLIVDEVGSGDVPVLSFNNRGARKCLSKPGP